MNILFAGKNISNNNSYEFINIITPLEKIGYKSFIYDFVNDPLENQLELNENISKNKIDLFFIFPVENELDLTYFKNLPHKCITLAYFYDDTWRIDYSLKWIQKVDYIVTTDINWKLNFINYKHKVIYCPFFINIDNYKKIVNCEKKYDVSFVGQYHPSREWIINIIRNNGIDVKVFGKGWGNNSEIDFNSMIEVFNQSKINLNLSNCINFDIRHLLDLKNNKLLSLLRSYKLIYTNLYLKDMKIYEMVKARFFEINACGGFQLSFYAQGLENLYTIGDEIEIYENINQLIRKIKYYLNNEDERDIIAENGYLKTINSHSSELRLKYIMSFIK